MVRYLLLIRLKAHLSRYARNSSGQSGAVPASYVEMITDNPPEEVIPSDVIEYPSSY